MTIDGECFHILGHCDHRREIFKHNQFPCIEYFRELQLIHVIKFLNKHINSGFTSNAGKYGRQNLPLCNLLAFEERFLV